MRWENPWLAFFGNVAAMCSSFGVRPAALPVFFQGFGRNALLPKHRLGRGLFWSAALHATLIGTLLTMRAAPRLELESPLRHARITNYALSNSLPAWRPFEKPTPKPAQAVRTTAQVTPAPPPARPPVLAVNRNSSTPTNRSSLGTPAQSERMLLTPVPVRIPHLEPLPNLMVNAARPKLELPPQPIEVARGERRSPRPAPESAPMANLPSHPLPLKLPAAAMPTPESSRVGALELPALAAPVTPPRLVPQQRKTAAAEAPVAPPPVAPLNHLLPSLPEKAQAIPMLALSKNPAEARGPINVPLGVHEGQVETPPPAAESKAAPHENPPSPPLPVTPGEAKSSTGGTLSAGLMPPGAPSAPSTAVVVATPKPATTPALRDMMTAARASVEPRRATPPRTLYPEPGSVDASVFGIKEYYAVTVNMPNLSSAAGSWEIHFAERQGRPSADDPPLRAPVAIHKVDPGYPADLIRDGVEGSVMLYAVIRADGSVSDIHLLNGVESRLNANAAAALAKWRFQPATKNGQAVELEAVVKVPFRARRLIR